MEQTNRTREQQLQRKNIKQDEFKHHRSIEAEEHRPSKGTGGHRHHRRNKRRKLLTISLIVTVVLLLLVIAALFGQKAIREFKTEASTIKIDLQEVLIDIKEMNPDAAEKSLDKVDEDNDRIESMLNKPLWRLAASLPIVSGDVNSARVLLSVFDQASEKIFRPFLSKMKEYPLEELRIDNGFNVNQINGYLDFLDTVSPDIDDISKQIEDVNFKFAGSTISGYLDKVKGLFRTFSIVKENEDFIRVIIGNGENRCYLIMAQNTAEIRASGGFPGAAGFITVKDGMLKVGDMSSIVDFVAYGNPVPTGTTEHENVLFGDLYIWQDRDACYNPHFPKVASISAISCENFTDTKVDGVISMTPHIVQEMLKITGETVVLDDGTEINGDNALQVIDRDLYVKYKGSQEKAGKNEQYLDSLFSDAAKKTMKSFSTRFQLTDADKYMDMFEQGFKNRTIMIWMKDAEEEEIVTKAGASGKLNFDPDKPEIGVFFGCDDAARLGMFIRIDVEIGESQDLEQSTKEYPVTVTLTNYLNEVDLGNADNFTYLAGNYGGAISSFVHLFAPAGGTISNIQLSNGYEMRMDEYEGLQVGYIYPMMIYPDEPVTITYKVTTAPGVTVKPTYVRTPTLQEY